MPWLLLYLEEYSKWFDCQDEGLQDEALAHLDVLRQVGPTLGRPRVDTLYGSKLANLKELRFSYKCAPIRILFAFAPRQQGVIILGGDKTGDKRWYKTSVPLAEKLYAEHILAQERVDIEGVKKKKGKKDKE